MKFIFMTILTCILLLIIICILLLFTNITVNNKLTSSHIIFITVISAILLFIIIKTDKKIIMSTFKSKWEHKSLEDMLSLVQITEQILKKNKIHSFVYCGTLLGVKRHKGIIPWDDDVDMAVFTDENTLKKLKSEFMEQGVGLVNSGDFYKTYLLKNTKIDGKDWSWPFVDLFYSNMEGKDVRVKIDDQDIVVNKTDTFPIKLARFNSINVNIPNNIDAHLLKLFGKNYMKDCISTSWNHREEKPVPMIYSMLCKKLIKN